MKAIVLPEYNNNIVRAMRSLQVNEISIPVPEAEQVLLKVAATPCNPSDIAFMRGSYNINRPSPAVMGFECSGTVVEAGKSKEAQSFLGKRVSCFAQGSNDGTWAEYVATDWRSCVALKDAVSFEQAASLCINPFTAFALISLASERKCRSIIQNGSSGQVGIFIRALAKRSGMNVINIVRKAEQIEKLHDEGEHWVLDISSLDFSDNLSQLATELEAGLAFDAVAGDSTGLILNAMPDQSDIIVYGGLSGQNICGVDTLGIIFNGKNILGFNLYDWKQSISREHFESISGSLQDLILDGTLRTRIQGIFPFETAKEAVEQYIRNMSKGKILFKP